MRLQQVPKSMQNFSVTGVLRDGQTLFTIRPPNIPIPLIAPAENGNATIQSRWLATALLITPDTETSAITAKDVASTDCACRLVYRCSAGTVTKPPPTHSRPDNKPAITPDSESIRAYGSVQISLPMRIVIATLPCPLCSISYLTRPRQPLAAFEH